MKNRGTVAYKDGMISKESLPRELVLYPGHYGAFFGFMSDTKEQVSLCECSRVAVENYVYFRLKYKPDNAIPERNFILDSMYFPIALVRQLMNDKVSEDENIIEKIHFEQDLCHECNHQVPAYKYCAPMYGGLFTQTYGWYINKQSFEMGIEPVHNRILFDKVSDELLDIIKIDPEDIWQDYSRQEMYNKGIEEKRKDFEYQNRQLSRLVENEVRSKFGFRNVGESWANETLIYQIMKKLFPDDQIIFHYRPDWLQGLEIDIFNETKKIGIEYQGIQHYKPVEHWGGEEALQRTVSRDKKKRTICGQQRIRLVYITYREEVSSQLVLDRMGKKIP